MAYTLKSNPSPGMPVTREQTLLSIYETLLESLGPSRWWPAETPFEVCIGAILTQNTNWSNVEKALKRLKTRHLLDPRRIAGLSVDELGDIIRPAGYFRVKARRILNFLDYLGQKADWDLEVLKKEALEDLRSELLTVKGIGPETADSMLLYAFKKPSFVVDAYTERICSRHGLTPEGMAYEELRSFFMDVLPPDIQFLNEYHALLVRVGKNWCLKKEGRCAACPLGPLLEGTAPGVM